MARVLQATVPASTAPTLRVYENTSAVFLAWQVPGVYADLNGAPCLGFQIERREGSDTKPDVLHNSIGFKGLTGDAKAGPKRSDQWPFQRFTWTDFTAHVDKALSYRVTPMFGRLPKSGNDVPALTKGTPSAWSPTSVPMRARQGDLESYFNFGIVASPWFNGASQKVDPSGALLKKVFAKSRKGAKQDGRSIKTRKDALNELLDRPLPDSGKTMRQGLGGALLARLYALLDEVAANRKLHIYAAFFELDEPGVIARLKKIGKRAHVILGNGPHKNKTDDPEAAAARKLKGSVDLTRRRFAKSSAFVHNKFIVICEGTAADDADSVWTGSVNMTTTGCCTQVNNAIWVHDHKVAKQYFEQWQWLKECGNELEKPEPPAALENEAALTNGAKCTVWFTPTGKLPRKKKGQAAPDAHLPDLEYAGKLIANAKDGILCLFFQPGPAHTLLNDVIAAGKANPNKLYVRGVVNADPSTYRRNKKTGQMGGTKVAGLLHQDKGIPAAFDIVLPKAIQAGAADYLAAEKDGFDIVKIHSKCLVIDPNGEHPVVITGSHNLGQKASTANDENLVIIEGDAELAAEYAAHIMSVFNHFWYQFNVSPASQKYASAGKLRSHLKTSKVTPWGGLQRDGRWQNKFFTQGSPQAIEFKFWAPASKQSLQRSHVVRRARNHKLVAPL